MKAIIALEKITENGVRVELPLVSVMQEQLDQERRDLIERIRAVPEWLYPSTLLLRYTPTLTVTRALYHTDSSGEFIFPKDSYKPAISQINLEEYLAKVLEKMAEQNPEKTAPPNLTKGSGFAQWERYSSVDPFIPIWVSLERIARQVRYLHGIIEFAKQDQEGKKYGILHPVYNYILKNGRASASSPNIQVTSNKNFSSPFVCLQLTSYRLLQRRQDSEKCLYRLQGIYF